MQDDKPETTNNMQADEHASPEVTEVSIAPGPSIFNWRKVLPNSLTILATVVGLSAFRFALEGSYELGVLSILAAGLLDGLDGPVARAVHDYVNFGVSPALLLYFWTLEKLGWYGWAVCLVYTVCMGCRLARFNAGVDFNASKITRSFFMGVPAPAGAMLVQLPILCTFQFGNKAIFKDPIVVIPFTLFVSFMLISRVPTFSSKMINRAVFGQIGVGKVVLFASFAIGLVTLIVTNTWLFLIVIAVAYVLSFPVSYVTFRVWSKKSE